MRRRHLTFQFSPFTFHLSLSNRSTEIRKGRETESHPYISMLNKTYIHYSCSTCTKTPSSNFTSGREPYSPKSAEPEPDIEA